MNDYGRQLTDDEIRAKVHRKFVGGLWEEMGGLQLDFLKRHGLLPHHRLVDIGCGALRGGIPFVRYLDAENYFGLDINASLIAAGKLELEAAGLARKKPALLVNDRFEMSRFGVRFDFAIAQSVFTHLPMNCIIRCLAEVRGVLKPTGILFATCFEAPSPAHLHPLTHPPAGMVTHYDADPFHYSPSEFEWMASLAGLNAEWMGDWNHPRGQKMVAFRAG